MKYLASEYNVGYPVHGAKFLDNSTLLVTGGDTQRSDVSSKLTALKIDFNKKKVIKRFREITLDAHDDCPTTLDAAKVINQGPMSHVILMGCNEINNTGDEATPNHHLRKFVYENEHLKFLASADFNRSNDPSEYTKLTALSADGSVGAIASSKIPTVIRILDPLKLEEKYEIETGSGVKDLHFSPDGKVICYITETTLEVISIVTGRFIVRKTDFNKNLTLSKVRFLTNDTVVVAAILNDNTKNITISKINIKSKDTNVLTSKSINSNYTGITAMDASNDGQLISLSTNENSLLIIKSKDLSVARSFKHLHTADITRVVFAPDSQYVASVSSANTVHVVKLPPGLAQSTSFFHKLFQLFIKLLLSIGIIGIAYLAYYFDLHKKSYHYINAKYLAKRDTSQYFQMNDGGLETTTDMFDDIISISTLTGKINTDDISTNVFSAWTSKTHDVSSYYDFDDILSVSTIQQESKTRSAADITIHDDIVSSLSDSSDVTIIPKSKEPKEKLTMKLSTPSIESIRFTPSTSSILSSSSSVPSGISSTVSTVKTKSGETTKTSKTVAKAKKDSTTSETKIRAESILSKKKSSVKTDSRSEKIVSSDIASSSKTTSLYKTHSEIILKPTTSSNIATYISTVETHDIKSQKTVPENEPEEELTKKTLTVDGVVYEVLAVKSETIDKDNASTSKQHSKKPVASKSIDVSIDTTTSTTSNVKPIDTPFSSFQNIKPKAEKPKLKKSILSDSKSGKTVNPRSTISEISSLSLVSSMTTLSQASEKHGSTKKTQVPVSSFSEMTSLLSTAETHSETIPVDVSHSIITSHLALSKHLSIQKASSKTNGNKQKFRESILKNSQAPATDSDEYTTPSESGNRTPVSPDVIRESIYEEASIDSFIQTSTTIKSNEVKSDETLLAAVTESTQVSNTEPKSVQPTDVEQTMFDEIELDIENITSIIDIKSKLESTAVASKKYASSVLSSSIVAKENQLTQESITSTSISKDNIESSITSAIVPSEISLSVVESNTTEISKFISATGSIEVLEPTLSFDNGSILTTRTQFRSLDETNLGETADVKSHTILSTEEIEEETKILSTTIQSSLTKVEDQASETSRTVRRTVYRDKEHEQEQEQEQEESIYEKTTSETLVDTPTLLDAVIETTESEPIQETPSLISRTETSIEIELTQETQRTVSKTETLAESETSTFSTIEKETSSLLTVPSDISIRHVETDVVSTSHAENITPTTAILTHETSSEDVEETTSSEEVIPEIEHDEL